MVRFAIPLLVLSDTGQLGLNSGDHLRHLPEAKKVKICEDKRTGKKLELSFIAEKGDGDYLC